MCGGHGCAGGHRLCGAIGVQGPRSRGGDG